MIKRQRTAAVLQDVRPVEIFHVNGISLLAPRTVDAGVTLASSSAAGSVQSRFTFKTQQ